MIKNKLENWKPTLHFWNPYVCEVFFELRLRKITYNLIYPQVRQSTNGSRGLKQLFQQLALISKQVRLDDREQPV